MKVTPEPDALHARASELARSLAWLPGYCEEHPFRGRFRTTLRSLQPLFMKLEGRIPGVVTDDVHWLRDNLRLLESDLEDLRETFKTPQNIPHVRSGNGGLIPRIAALAGDFLVAVSYEFEEAAFTRYVQGFQDVTALNMAELWELASVMKLILLEQIALRSPRLFENGSACCGVGALVRSLRDISQTSWKTVIEPLILFDHVLREDPAGVYPHMDYDSRDLYRRKLANIADHSDCSEIEVAQKVLVLAREASNIPDNDPRMVLRRSHVGTYLVAEGTALLEQKVGFHPPVAQRLHGLLRAYPDRFYLSAIAIFTFAIMSMVVLSAGPLSSLAAILFITLALLLPSSQSAVQIVNHVVTTLLPAEILPKLDLSEGLPENCVTLVCVPAVLLSAKQVHKLVEDLEVRYLGNHDANLHFALLTDLADSPEQPQEESELINLCAELIRKLNEKYAGQQSGKFLLLHRPRIYNPRERLWMGWERKRGKLMDLNCLLCGQDDRFSVKVGDLSLLSSVRFVITLDSDTELPRGTAHRMVGALAHVLNQAILDPERGIVIAGYGILQPRVGVSVQSTARSRLASIYSGQTGFDIYTRAVSDIYQDLYGEGIFVGKGIYEVATLHRVLDRRFPRNALLSHDLIEGAYARAGLVSDVEIIEDYPSHYSAYARRKHRWLRGDWQITGWLRPYVLNELAQSVPNPISVVSQWKIFDNLRRSLVEPAIFLLFALGWTLLPGDPAFWTLAALSILFLPAGVQLLFDLVRAAVLGRASIAQDAFDTFVDAAIADILTLTFLAHQALLSIDAVVRTMVRRLITRRRLLQWETAAQAELSARKPTALDRYLDWTPLLALALFATVWFLHRAALVPALPILLLWACSRPVSHWLNQPPRAPHKQVNERDRWLLRVTALRIWRYFAEFGTEEHNWLVPDNVQQQPPSVAARVSPTNLGFLFNASQVACEFGYLTVPEFAQRNLRIFVTLSRLPRYRGHLFNWFDTHTLAPLPPVMVSTVDSGNLAASLWTLQQGCLALLNEPLLPPELASGLLDHLYALASRRALRRRQFRAFKEGLRGYHWLSYVQGLDDASLASIGERASKSKHARDTQWFGIQVQERIHSIRQTVHDYLPWLLPEFAELKSLPGMGQLLQSPPPALQRLPSFIDMLASRLRAAQDSGLEIERCTRLLSLLEETRIRVVALIEDLKKLSEQARLFVKEMDFSFLLNQHRRLLSVGYDVGTNELHPACYDLLATESRIAAFVAIAKDDVHQETWFMLGRPHTLHEGRAVLLSWTGTMFEYLMPALWMRIYPNTLLERSLIAAVRSQRAYVSDKHIPWGISESAYFMMDESGNYQYYAFGVPQLAAHKQDEDAPVISPYSSFLALPVDSVAALRNLREMISRGWTGTYGFYEAVDFHRSRRRSWFRQSEIVPCWMAHHQGMSLLAIANFLHDDIAQRWFHSHPRVQATELLLQEKPATHFRPVRSTNRSRAA